MMQPLLSTILKQPMDMPRADGSKGSVLFLILIAVALFAAITYVVTSSTRSGDARVPAERFNLSAGQLMQYAVQIEQGLERMRVVSDVRETDLDVYTPWAAGYSNANCTSNKCRLFSPEGGGAVWRQMEMDPSVAGDPNNQQNFYVAEVQNVGTSAPDLLLWIAYIPQGVCQAINYKMGVMPSAGTAIPSEARGGSVQFFTMTAAFPSSSKVWGIDNPQFSGKHDFCYYDTSGLFGNVYVHVVYAR